MAIVAILLDRRVLVQVWTSFFRVTFIAEVIDRGFLQHFVVKLTMRVMTVDASNLAFLYGMVGLLVYHGFDVPMALIAHFGFFRFQKLISSSVGRMAIITRNVLDFVPATIPKSLVLHHFMAGEAFCSFCGWICFFVECKDIYSSSATFFNMLCSGTVAGFASVLRCWPFHMFFGMDGRFIGLVLGFMAALTGVSAYETLLRDWLLCRIVTAIRHRDRGQQENQRK